VISLSLITRSSPCFSSRRCSTSLRETIQISRDYFKKVPSLRDFHYRARKLKHVIKILIKFIQGYFQGDSAQTIHIGVGKRYLSEIKMLRGI
ncbi:MAG: hypothetical protein DRP24_00585, partial [Thermotoga sp.]